MIGGTIEINDHQIGRWTAIRKERKGGDSGGPRFRYRCSYELNGSKYHFDVYHYFNDGAAVLMAYIMNQAMEFDYENPAAPSYRHKSYEPRANQADWH